MGVIEDRRAAVMECFRSPKTINQAISELRISYHTLWRAMQPLIDQGAVVECTWRDGRQKVFVTIGESQDGVVKIVTPGSTLPVGEWATTCYRTPVINNIYDISGALAQTYRYSAYRGTQDEHLAGSMTPVECKAILRESLIFVQRLQIAIEQMLLAPIWDSTKEAAERFGPVEIRNIVQVGEAFEKRHGRG